MTDKEQIMIDGVDVSKCRYFRPGSALTCSRMYGGACDNKYSNELCYFKQLAHKTRECEELKKQLDKQVKDSANRYSELNREWNNRCKKYADDLKSLNRYRKALEEIEGLATNLRTRTDYHSVDEVNVDIENILDIILEAKGEKNAR
ncbi:unknown [Clostridium sp. CAG:306]|nr:unknown [Clostridium sp. CAG:306]